MIDQGFYIAGVKIFNNNFTYNVILYLQRKCLLSNCLAPWVL